MCKNTGYDGMSKKLSNLETRNLLLLVLSYACLMSSITIIVGTSSVIVISLENEGDDYTNITPLAFALFMFGTAFISIGTTKIFMHGRKIGFIVGNICGITGAILGGIALYTQSLTLLFISYVPLGASNGIGNYLRFAAVEVVPTHFQALAVTLVLSGGVISAFMGPEAAQATDVILQGIPFMNIFILLGFFNLVMAALACFAKFPSTPKMEEEKASNITAIEPEVDLERKEVANEPTFFSKILSRNFWIPALLATFSWGLMTMPMCITRVAMQNVGYTPRESLTVIEVHFLGMFIPGFVAGKIIKRKGTIFTLLLSFLSFIIGLIFNIICQGKEDGTVITWMLGLFFVGAAWNLGFASATILVTQVYADCVRLKPKIQACNDFTMFAISGAMIVSTGYIYKPPGLGYISDDKLYGWKVVNYVTLGYVGIFGGIIILLHQTLKRKMTLSKSVASNEERIDIVENGKYEKKKIIHEES